MAKYLRFGVPIAFAAAGWAFAFIVVREIARSFGDLVTYNMTDLLPGNIAQEITLLLGIIPIAGIIVYLFLGIFIATIIMLLFRRLGNRIS